MIMDEVNLNLHFPSAASGTTSTVGWSIETVAGGKSFAVQNNNNVSTLNNTLDDGSGNVLVSGALSVAGALLLKFAGNYSTPNNGIVTSSSGGGFIDAVYGNILFQSGAATNSAWAVLPYTTGSYTKACISVTNASTTRYCITETALNTLDDGTGNMSVTGNLTVGGSLENSPGSFPLPSSAGTLATTKNYLVAEIITPGGSFVNAYYSSEITVSGATISLNFLGLALVTMTVTGSVGQNLQASVSISPSGSALSPLGATTFSTNGPSAQSGATETISGQCYIHMATTPNVYGFNVSNLSSYTLVVSVVQLA